MKRLQKFLAMMLTVIMCVGTPADTGLTVFAADAEDEAVAEDAADEEGTSEETVVPAEEQADEDEDPVADEPADDGAVTKLVVNGTNMLTKAGKYLKPNGEHYSGSFAEPMEKPYMYYDTSEGRLLLHDITLDGKYGDMSDGRCSTGIEFAGDKLIVEVIGKCRIAQDGVAGDDAYGINADGDLIIRNTTRNRKAVPGSLGILPASNANWISSIKCSGNLTVEGVHGSADTDDNAPLKLDTDASDVSRYVDGSEIDCAGDLTVKDALISVKAADHGVNTKAINCGGNISIESGTVEAESDGNGTEVGRYAIKAEGNISIGEKAEVSAVGCGKSGFGIFSSAGKVIINGTVYATGKFDPIYANSEIVLGEGTAITTPAEGKLSGYHRQIVTWEGTKVTDVRIEKGHYLDIWVSGKRLGTWDKDIRGLFTPAELNSSTFDAETNTLELNNVDGISYFDNGSPTVPSDKPAIYTKVPLTIKGNNTKIEYDGKIISTSGADINIQGDLNLKSADGIAVYAGGASITVEGEETVLKAQSDKKNAIEVGFSGAIVINSGRVEAKAAASDSAGIYCDGDITINGGEVTAEGGKYAIEAFGENKKITLADGITIAEPTGGKVKSIQEGKKKLTTIVDSSDNAAKKVKLTNGKYELWVEGSPFNPIPERLEEVTDLILVKGQKFNMPTNGWSVEKDSKKYVSVSKKGKVSAKKETPEGTVAKITDGNRTIEIKIIKPHFEKKTIKLEAKGTYEAASCGFIVGDDSVPVAYYSSAYDVAQISTDGKIYAKTYGTATITAFVNGKAYTTKVKVTEPTPLKERKIHINVNVKKKISIKGVKIKEWSTSESEAQYVTIKNSTVKASMTGEYVLIGKDKDGNEYVVRLVVEDPEIAEPVFTEDLHKPGSNKYKLVLGVGEVTKLKFKSMDQPVIFRSGKGAVAYADEKLNITPQTSGKCKLTAKINGKTVTISVKVE